MAGPMTAKVFFITWQKSLPLWIHRQTFISNLIQDVKWHPIHKIHCFNPDVLGYLQCRYHGARWGEMALWGLWGCSNEDKQGNLDIHTYHVSHSSLKYYFMTNYPLRQVIQIEYLIVQYVLHILGSIYWFLKRWWVEISYKIYWSEIGPVSLRVILICLVLVPSSVIMCNTYIYGPRF